MHRTIRRTFAAYLLPVTLFTGVAAGIVSTPSNAAAQSDMEEAKAAFREGKRLYEKEDYKGAAENFQTAYELSDREELLYNIGQAYRKAGQLEKAEKYFQQYLQKKPNAENSEQVVQKVVEIQEKLAARMASIRIETATDGRNVHVDDEQEPRCQTPCNLSVDAGERRFQISGSAAKTVTKTVEVEKGGEKTLRVTLPEKGTPGGLHVRTEAGGGSLLVQGVGESSLPLSKPLELPSGTYQMQVTGSSGGTWSGEVEIESGETSRLLVSTGSAGGGSSTDVRRGIAYGLAGASVALIAGGLLVGQNAQRTHDILSTQQSRAGTVDRDLVSEGRREQTTANVLLGAGAATLVSGVGLFVWDAVDSNERSRTAGTSSESETTTAKVGPRESDD